MKRRLFASIALLLSLLFVTTSVHAEDMIAHSADAAIQSSRSLRSFNPTFETVETEEAEMVPFDFSTVDPDQIAELPVENRTIETDPGDTEIIEKDVTPSVDTSINLNEGASDSLRNSQGTQRSTRASSADYELYQFDGTITQAGGSWYIYPIYLAPDEAIHVQMEIPRTLSLDYDIGLYQFDMNTGSLINAAVDYCSYPTNESYIQEAVGTVNTDSISTAYAVFVDSYMGASATETFHLNIAIYNNAANSDIYETDESVFRHKISMDFSSNLNPLSHNRTLTTPIDNDWYAIYVPDTSNFDTIDIAFTNGGSGVTAELYKTVNGTQMLKTGSTTGNGSLKLAAGWHYMRIKPTTFSMNFSPIAYTVTITPKLIPSRAVGYVLSGGAYPSTGWCIRKSNRFTGGVSRYIIDMGTVSGAVKYFDKNGYPVLNVSDTITFIYENDSQGSKNTATSTCIAGTNYARTYPMNTGGMANPNTWDSVYFTVRSERFGTLFAKSGAYVRAYQSSELQSSCDHSKTCGWW